MISRHSIEASPHHLCGFAACTSAFGLLLRIKPLLDVSPKTVNAEAAHQTASHFFLPLVTPKVILTFHCQHDSSVESSPVRSTVRTKTRQSFKLLESSTAAYDRARQAPILVPDKYFTHSRAHQT